MLTSNRKLLTRLGAVVVAVALCAGAADHAIAKPIKDEGGHWCNYGGKLYAPGEIVTVTVTDGNGKTHTHQAICADDGKLYTIVDRVLGPARTVPAPGRVIDPDSIVAVRKVGTAPPRAPIH